MLLVKSMLVSKLHFPKGFDLILFSYEIFIGQVREQPRFLVDASVLKFYFTERVHKVVLTMSIPAQIRQLIY